MSCSPWSPMTQSESSICVVTISGRTTTTPLLFDGRAGCLTRTDRESTTHACARQRCTPRFAGAGPPLARPREATRLLYAHRSCLLEPALRAILAADGQRRFTGTRCGNGAGTASKPSPSRAVARRFDGTVAPPGKRAHLAPHADDHGLSGGLAVKRLLERDSALGLAGVAGFEPATYGFGDGRDSAP